jgi:hypothetical protein
MTERVGAAVSAQTSTEHFRAAESALDPPVNPQFGNALIESRPEPVSESEAATIPLAGQKT